MNGKLTNHLGIVQILPTKAGTLIVRAAKQGYLRDAARVHVS